MKHRYKTKNTLKETADSPKDLKQLVKDRCESCEPKSQEGHPEKEEDTNYTIQSWDDRLGFSQMLSPIKEHPAFVSFSRDETSPQSILAKPDSENMEPCTTSVLFHSLSTLPVSPLSSHKDFFLHQHWYLPRPEISWDFASNVKFTPTYFNTNALSSDVFQGQKSKQSDQGEVRPQNVLYEHKRRCGHLCKYKEVDDSDSSIISLEKRPAPLLVHSSLTKHGRQEDVDVFDPLRKRRDDDSDSELLPTCSNQLSAVGQQVPELSCGFQNYLPKPIKRRKRRKSKPSKSKGLINSQCQTRLAKTNPELEPLPVFPFTQVPHCSYQPDSDSFRIDPSASPVHSSAISSGYTKHEDVDVFKSLKKKRKHANNGPKLLPTFLKMPRQSESLFAAKSLQNCTPTVYPFFALPEEWIRMDFSNFSYSNDSSSVPLDLSISQHQTEQTKMFVPKLSSLAQSTSLPVTNSPECSDEEKLEVKQAEINPVIENDKGETLSPVRTASVFVTNTLQPSSHFQFNSTDSCCLTRFQSLSSLNKIPKKNLTRAASLPDMSLKEFTPDITADDFNDDTYLFQCSSAGLYQCSVTGLVFVMKGEGDVVYRTVPWNRRLLAQHHKKPAGPLFDIKCQQQSVCQLHLPHCELISTGGGQFLQVAHVNDEGIEFITPHRITERHVVINITGFSGYGNVKDEDAPPDPVRALVLLFYKLPVVPDLTSFLSVLLLPDNVVLRDVLHSRKKLVGHERYIETSPHCKLHPKQVYTLSAVPEDDSVLVQPTEAEFDEASYDNYFPSFQVILEKIMKTIKLTLRDSTSSHNVWQRQVYLSSSGVKKCCEPVPLNLSLNDKLLNVRSCFINGISAPVLNSLLDKLLEKTVITDAEREEADVMQNRSNRARFVIDTVRKKGKAASSQIIKSLSEIDPFFCKSLGLI